MRVTLLPLLLAGAGLVATASPIRVVVVSGHNDVSSFTRIRVSSPFLPNIFRPEGPGVPMAETPQQSSGHRHLCSKLRNKALDISNKFREAFGLPLLMKTPESTPTAPVDEMKILPFIGTPPIALPSGTNDEHHGEQPVEHHDGHKQDLRHHRKGGCHRSFTHRLHRALMVLGPWEGRAVAFVLGCGIGVLLRMFWVIAIVVARSFKSRKNNDDSDVEHILIFERDAEDIVVSPPQYTDEKVALVAEGKVDATA
ncbi:hypothetical protein BC835DRAFT_1513108 [Cytidiella melzeri]|nr:hypothetical protein BC835DRAFT_1513108 [Cytidiella melzeri]